MADDMDMDSVGENIESDEEAMDEELLLPEVLANISYNEKRELLRFKRDHSEKQWEEEISRRSDLLSRKIDMERLKRMSKGNKGGISEDKKSKTSNNVVTPSRGGKRVTRRVSAVRTLDSEEESVENEDDEYYPQAAADKDDDEEDFPAIAPPAATTDEEEDELFDSEEEEEINKRGTASAASGSGKASKALGAKRKALESPRDRGGKVRRSSRHTSRPDDEEEDEDYFAEDKEPDDEELDTGMDIDVGQIKGRYFARKERSGYHEGEAERKVAVVLSPFEYVASTSSSFVDEAEMAAVEDYQRIQTRRIYMEKWVAEPFFESAVVGTFVRLVVGETPDKSTAVYRMCEVVAIEYNQRQYKLLDGSVVTTRLTVGLAGNIRKHVRIDMVSNSRITQKEFSFYLESLKTRAHAGEGYLQHLTKTQVNYIRQRIVEASNHVYTNDEIQNMVKLKLGLNRAATTEYSTAMEDLEQRRALAAQEQDYDVLELLQKTIDKFKTQMAAEKEKFDMATRKSLEVNKRNRESNMLRDMKAGMRKRQEDHLAAKQGIKSQAEADPFIRRETKPKILWNTGKRLAEADANKDKEKPAAAATSAVAKPSKSQQAVLAPDGEMFTASNVSLNEIRRRVAQKLGADPFEACKLSPRERYLKRVCAGLPPAGSEGRAKLRGRCKTLAEILGQLARS